MNHLKGWRLNASLIIAAWAATSSVQALQFGLDEMEGSLSSRLSLGGSWRLEDPNLDYVSDGNRKGEGRASQAVNDDGTLNFKKGKMFSLVFKGRHDLSLDYHNFGLFTRLRYWYDYELEKGDRPHGNGLNRYQPDEPLDDSEFNDFAKSSGAKFLDAYIYAGFDIGNVPIDLRLGRQVVSWGESTFIQNGVNVISSVDLTALRKPGSELKDALLPVGLFYASAGLTDNLSVEAFYQYEWEGWVLEGCGNFFSPSDLVPEGCPYLTALDFVSDYEQVNPGSGIELEGTPIPINIPRPSLSRGKDLEPDDTGQYGIAFRYYAEALHSTEFGLYYINYHSRLPIFSTIRSDEPTVADLGGNALYYPILQASLLGGNPKFIAEYPEDIELFGISFSTNVLGVSIGGEITHRPEFPLQINTPEVSQAAALGSVAAPWSSANKRAEEAGFGGIIHGYDLYEFTQIQFTVIQFIDQVVGADQLALIFEVGANFIGGLPDTEEIRYGRDPIYGVGDFGSVNNPLFSLGFGKETITCQDQSSSALPANPNVENCTDEGFITDSAWGYHLVAALDYNNVFAGVNLTPHIAFSHSVEGTSPPPNFNEDVKSLSLGLAGDYMNRYTSSLSVTQFYGGDYSTIDDRDFVSLSFGVSF